MTGQTSGLSLRAKIIGTLIHDARAASGKTVTDCAQKIGVTPERFDQYERGLYSPSLPELEGIAYYLNVPLDQFWGRRAMSTGELPKHLSEMNRLILLRQRMIGAMVRQARLETKLSLQDVADRCGMHVDRLEAYELGEEPIPIIDLEILSGVLHRSIREFMDQHGPVGVWVAQQRAIQDFLTLPVELQIFVSKPINKPYLELAARLSEMAVDRLRAIAEGLLEITY
jgi:transcriptional regulator with XRE-family HTH domain